MLQTGQRKKEVASLTWADLTLDGNAPQALIRDATTKDKKKRAVPLRPELAALLQAAKPSAAVDTDAVFLAVPTWEQIRADLRRAGIEQKDKLGRVVHFHAFRKTLQTLGVHAGINQRSAQALLGHSDPSLTANVYTDVAALDLHEEVAKLPWIGKGTEKMLQLLREIHAAGARRQSWLVEFHVFHAHGQSWNFKRHERLYGAKFLAVVETYQTFIGTKLLDDWSAALGLEKVRRKVPGGEVFVPATMEAVRPAALIIKTPAGYRTLASKVGKHVGNIAISHYTTDALKRSPRLVRQPQFDLWKE